MQIEVVESLNDAEQSIANDWWRSLNEELFGVDVVANAEQNGTYQTKFLFKAVEEEKLVGFVNGICSLGLGYIHELIIDPEFRGKGLGGDLLNKAEQFCAERGVFRLALRTAAQSQAVIFYKNRGWQTEFENKDWYGGQIYLQMRKDLPRGITKK